MLIVNGLLEKDKIKEIAICGYSSQLCCNITAIHANLLGYNVLFIKDAISPLVDSGIDNTQLMIQNIQEQIGNEIITTKDLIQLLKTIKSEDELDVAKNA